MQLISRRIPLGALLLVLVQLAAGALAQPQGPDQQRCITALNGGFAKVAKARSKAALRCAKAAQKGEAFETCLADAQPKLDKALAKLESTETKKCSAAPDFGPTDRVALGDSATELADAALSDLFGLAPGGVIADKKAEKDTARCQLGVAKAAQKCALARVAAFNRCKKAGLKDGSIASAADLAACLDDDAGGKLAKSCTAKLAKAADRCSGVDLPAAFPACGATDAAGLASCADGRLVCRARDALAAADALDAPGCGAITPEPETELAATAEIGPDGGEVSAVGGDGTVYRLEVPEGALVSETAITITPVSAIPDLPLTGGLLAAVELAPDGLQLWQPATLTIELPSAPDPADLAGFGWTGAGENVHLSLVQVEGSVLTLGVTHFSGAGAAIVAPENLAALLALPPGSVEQQYLNQFGSVDIDDPLSLVAWLKAWYDGGVAALLGDATASDDALLEGLSEFVSWNAKIEDVIVGIGVDPDFFLGLDGFALANRIDEGLALAATALREGVIRNDVECLAEEDLAYAEAELRWQAIAQSLGLATPENGLDLATVMSDFCAEVVYDTLDYPQAPQVGAPGTLTVKVGVAIDGGAPSFDADFTVDVFPEGTEEEFVVSFDAPGGEGQADFTPDGSEELALQIDACLFAPDDYPVLSDGKLCQDALVVRGFDVTPETAELEPGEQQSFEALLYGAPHPGVTWTATGGTITPGGVYTAGDVAGTFTVTATSSSGHSETASVTIGEGTEPSLTFEPVSFSGNATAGTADCEPPVPSNVSDLADLADYPGFALSAMQGNGSGQSALDVAVDEATGVVTITASAMSSASSGPCPPDAFFPNTSGIGTGVLDFQFEFDPGETPYTFEITGSVSGSGEYDVEVLLFPQPTPGANLVACRIADNGNADELSCPGGSALSDTGPLSAGVWRLNARASTSAGAVFSASSASYDFTLTLTPQ